MMRDIEFFQTKLGKIDGFGGAGDALMTIVKAKEVQAAPAATEQAAESTATSEETTNEASSPIPAENGEAEKS